MTYLNDLKNDKIVQKYFTRGTQCVIIQSSGSNTTENTGKNGKYMRCKGYFQGIYHL